MGEKIAAFLSSAGVGGARPPTVILTGAGSSECAARSIESVLRRKLGCEVTTVSTSYLVTNCETAFLPGGNYLLISFSRSGNSPESVAVFQRVASQFPRVAQAVITCDDDGELAHLAMDKPKGLLLLLPEETNDKSVAVTGSFSCLALAGLFLSCMSSDDIDLAVDAAEHGARRISKPILIVSMTSPKTSFRGPAIWEQTHAGQPCRRAGSRCRR